MSNYTRFRDLHVPGKPLVLFNVWDAGSAKAVAASGCDAIATSSWSVANAHGYTDGEKVPLAFAIENLRRIVQSVDVPVSIDLESGYDDVSASVRQAVEAGAVGCNLEDSYPENGSLRPIGEQVRRIREARRAAGESFFLNARTDVYFHPGAAIEEVLERARAYAEAGADGLFVPGLADEPAIARLTAESPLPVNIMTGPDTPPLRRLRELRVARVSHGPGPWLAVMKALEQAARDAAIAD
jgi:2-methylisocitrate lyase-like PEP mutase family enzyme